MSIDIEVGSQRVESKTITRCEDAMGISAPALISTSASIEATIFPPRSITAGFVSVPHEFLQHIVE